MKDKILEILHINISAIQLVNDDDPIELYGIEKSATEIELLINQEVERRIKERMGHEGEAQIAQNEYEEKEEWTRYNTQWCFRDFIAGVDWLRSRLTNEYERQVQLKRK